jgi:hypothetical protein
MVRDDDEISLSVSRSTHTHTPQSSGREGIHLEAED